MELAKVRHISSARPIQEKIVEKEQEEKRKGISLAFGFMALTIGVIKIKDDVRKFMCAVWGNNKNRFEQHTFNWHLPYYRIKETEYNIDEVIKYCEERNIVKVHQTKIPSFVQIELLMPDKWDLRLFEEHGHPLTEKQVKAFIGKGPIEDIPAFEIQADVVYGVRKKPDLRIASDREQFCNDLLSQMPHMPSRKVD